MKKTSVYSLLFLSSLLFSCGGSNTDSTGNAGAEKTAEAPAAQKAMMAPPPAPLTVIPAPTGNVELFATKEAINYAANYMKYGQKLPQYSFVFNTQELIDYIDASQSSIVNFVLGMNNAQDSLFLFMAPVGQDGGHQFYQRNDTCFVLSETYAVNISTTLEPQASNAIDTFFMEAMSTSKAARMIAAFQNAPRISKNNGWLYNAHDLAGYLHAGIAGGGMQYTQFILALDDNGITHLIIVGSNDGTNHMYFEFNTTQCVMENAKPCPYCDIISGGSTFDPPSCTY